MSSAPETSSRILGTVVVLALCLLGARTAADAWSAAGGDPTPCSRDTDCRERTRAVKAAPAELLQRDTVCRDAGYLCADPAEPDSFRVLRWPDPDRILTVVVPTPDEERGTAARLQRAAVRGVLRWDGTPMRIRVVEGRVAPADADVTLRWAARLDDGRLGSTRYEWRRSGETTRFRVLDLALVTRDPFDARRILTDDQVELAAAHEMGHALGLGHSDAPEDVMYPENTAVRLTARDYATVAALYRLPDGALVR
ncbi:MAG: matrixin family metalloprotease [Gemmatimonadota bacterium]